MSGELRAAARVTRETLANAYTRESQQIIRLGRARATRYAARQNLPELGTNEFPVFRVDETGEIKAAGTLMTLAAAEAVWLPDETVVDGLPPEMHDIAPRGFLGRSYARQHRELGLPDNVTNWSDHHILIALSHRGEDLPGNLVIGRESFDRYQNLRHQAHTANDFPALGKAALAGEHAGSSAGGEQPKFTALVDGRHRIIKFATRETDNARRWQDLLTLENLALQTLRDARIEAAESHLLDVDGLRCLIVNRFDRIGETGRRAVMTLAAASGQVNAPWSDAAQALHQRSELSDEDLRRMTLLDAFGALITNTDRHQHNVALFPTDTGYALAPAYDQLPMAYAPPASGNLRNTATVEPRPTVNTLEVWSDAQGLANEFWRRAADEQFTGSMRDIVREHAAR